MNSLLKLIAGELEQLSGKTYAAIFSEIWEHYEKNMLEWEYTCRPVQAMRGETV